MDNFPPSQGVANLKPNPSHHGVDDRKVICERFGTLPALGISVAFAAAVWILVDSLAQAFLDIADSHLNKLHKEQVDESLARAASRNL